MEIIFSMGIKEKIVNSFQIFNDITICMSLYSIRLIFIFWFFHQQVGCKHIHLVE